MAIIKTKSAKRILKLKNTSSRKVGSGSTIMATITKMPSGITESLKYRRSEFILNVSISATVKEPFLLYTLTGKNCAKVQNLPLTAVLARNMLVVESDS